jgi:hypothetical protein
MEPNYAPIECQSVCVSARRSSWADHSANLLNGVSAVTYGGSGIDEVEMLPAPISAVQLVLASIGAPGSR